eukprot:TRINITY_DN354_c0_g1_i1.p1 TRINITY_DN354_c0_g1~~TRINITY_DN354_c0_g1_i1.p1  ORF type:complete len:409 (-),score=61.16 TRINITY_DN354_c0_g1_i1:48-1274(-)
MPLNHKYSQYRICEIPLENLRGWKKYHKFKQDTRSLVESVSKGLLIHEPELSSTGEGGAYLLRAEDGSPLAIFKPFDEDPFSLRNPKTINKFSGNPPSITTFPNRQSNPPLRPGESAHKEVAAYLLDKDNLAGVPFTTLVKLFGISRWGPEGKIGSLQAFVQHEHDSWELSPSMYSINDVHKIALLDIRLINTDRHGGNILVRHGEKWNNNNNNNNNNSGHNSNISGFNNNYKLVPIDHGFCLPSSLEAEDLWFEWMSWPQSKLSVGSRLRKYIRDLDLEEDAGLLRGLGLSEDSIRTMLFCSVLLQQAMIKGLSLLQVAQSLCGRPISHLLPETSKGEHDLMMKAMRYRIEGLLEQLVGAPHSPPLYRIVPFSFDPIVDLKLRHRRQNSAPQLAGGPLTCLSTLGVC